MTILCCSCAFSFCFIVAVLVGDSSLANVENKYKHFLQLSTRKSHQSTNLNNTDKTIVLHHNVQNTRPMIRRSVEGLPDFTNRQVPINDTLSAAIKSSLKQMDNNFTQNVGGSVSMSCMNNQTALLCKLYLKTCKLQWIHNNHKLNFQKDRMMILFGTLFINEIKKHDQGVYLCRVEYLPTQYSIVTFYTLQVISKAVDIGVQSSLTLKLQCHSAPLGYLFPKAYRKWYLNGNVISTGSTPSVPTNTTLAKRPNDDTFRKATKAYKGDWKCIVTDPATDRNWTTALYVVKVLPPPSPWEMFTRNVQANPIVTTFICIAIALFITIIGITFFLKDKQPDSVGTDNEHLLNPYTEP